jgi:hypothetical protein
MQTLFRAWCANSLASQNFVVYILDHLQQNGTLHPLNETARATVNTIMFCDKLPS